MGTPSAGALLVVVGIVVVLVGLLVMTGALSWFGRLPGDLRFGDGGRMQVVIPLASMLVLSIVLSVVLALVRRFF